MKSRRSGRFRCRIKSARNITVPLSSETTTISRPRKSRSISRARVLMRRAICSSVMSTRSTSLRQFLEAFDFKLLIFNFVMGIFMRGRGCDLENRHVKRRVKIRAGQFHFEPPANRLASALGTFRLAGRQIEMNGNPAAAGFGFRQVGPRFENLTVLPQDFLDRKTGPDADIV